MRDIAAAIPWRQIFDTKAYIMGRDRRFDFEDSFFRIGRAALYSTFSGLMTTMTLVIAIRTLSFPLGLLSDGHSFPGGDSS